MCRCQARRIDSCDAPLPPCIHGSCDAPRSRIMGCHSLRRHCILQTWRSRARTRRFRCPTCPARSSQRCGRSQHPHDPTFQFRANGSGGQHLPSVQIRSDHFSAGAAPFSDESPGLLGHLWGRRTHQAGVAFHSFTLQVIEYSKYHVDSSKKSDGEDKPAKSEEEVKIWDTEFVKVDQGTLFELILVCCHAFLFWCPFA